MKAHIDKKIVELGMWLQPMFQQVDVSLSGPWVLSLASKHAANNTSTTYAHALK